ncbi:MAG: hypothetical protein KKD38_05335, partial [Candidatus Delongbacteria bacterium]|nr:hypothetical protein [Candidatus Delongbacteria bacterium]
MKNSLIRNTFVFALSFVFALIAFAQEKSEVSLPWVEFKNLTNIDKNMIIIPLETFEKLLIQTGKEDYKAYNIANGNVILSQSEFKKLVDGMKAPSGSNIKPPYDYLITKAVYKGKMKEENTGFSATFIVHVLKDDQYLKIPIVPNSTAVEDIKVNSKPALIVSENGYSNVVLQGKGEYKIEAAFSVKSSLSKGPHEFYLNINRTPITLFELEIPQPQIEVEIPQANQLTTVENNKTTTISAVIAESSNINVKWRKKFEIIEKLPAKVYADLNHLISIEDNALKTTTTINYNILHTEIEGVSVTIDDNVNILNIYGSGIGEWQEIIKDKSRIIMIPFTYGKKGGASVSIVTEVPLSAEGLETAFNGIKTLNTIRETGNIGIELNTSAEVIVTENKGLERIATQTLPVELINRSAKPLIEGFKYSKHPYQLMLNIKKHKKIGVPMAAVYSANVVTLFTEDGKIVHNLEYNIKNSSKQFLEIKLPQNAEVFSVFVNNNPVESSLNDDGKLLVPLIRSNSLNSSTDTFPVEVIYATSNDNFSFYGAKESALQSVDIFTSQIMWSVYLPNDYKYLYFDSSLEKEELIRGINIFGDERVYDEENEAEYDAYDKKDVGRTRDVRKAQLSEFRNAQVEETDQMIQMSKEKSFGSKMEDLAMSPSVSQSTTATGLM